MHMKWFQLDSDMPQDPKIRAVIRALGPAGVGGLVGIWCHVARHGSYPGRAVDSRGHPLALEELQEASLLPDDQFQSLLDICLRTGHFQRAAWEQSRGIWIPAMERRGDTYTQRHLKQQQQHLAFE
jgi:Lin1244/Lin1753-like, N-terminal